jgi:hypothetical protein
MASIVYEDEFVTEYNDGTTEVRFSDEEWEVMARSPRYFGLVLECGHGLNHFNPAEGCNACFVIAEELQGLGPDDDEAAQKILNLYPRAPEDEPVHVPSEVIS